jgi:hypothetical protein
MASAHLFTEFVQAAKEAAIDLDLNPKSISFSRAETPKIGLDYSAEIEANGRGFDFHLRTDTRDSDPTSGSMTATMTISFAEELNPYYFHEKFKTGKERPHSLSRWVSWAIFNFRQEHQKVNLQSLFSDMELRIYGIPGYGAEEEAELVFNGMLTTQREKVLVYKFRHITKESYLQRAISYAILVTLKNTVHHFWVVFPDSCGLDSGAAFGSYRHFENLIEKLRKKFDVEVRRYDIKYSEFELFLLKNASGFESCLRDYILKPNTFCMCCPRVLAGSEQKFDKLIEKFEQENYPETLRDLRALVQQAQENVLKAKMPEFQPPRKSNIYSLAEILVKKEMLDERQLPLFAAFHSIASMASHRDFPSVEEMKKPTLMRRIIITVYSGLQLIEELDDILFPPNRIVTSPKIEIV